MFSKNDLRKTAEETTHTAVERGAEALNDLKDYLAPIAKDVSDKVSPLANQAKDKVTPLANQAKDRISPFVDDVRDKVERDIAPKIADWWDDAQDNAVVKEASERGAAVLAAAQGNLKVAKKELSKKAKKAAAKAEKASKKATAKAEKKAQALATKADKKLTRKKGGKPILKGLGIAALVGAIVLAVRQFLAPKDDGWTPQQPSAPYQPRNAAADTDLTDSAGGPVIEDAQDPDGVDPLLSTETDEAAPADDDVTDAELSDLTVGDIFEVSDEPADETGETDVVEGDGGDPFRYGEGSFIGDTPPEAFTIKGNERSMKYHTPESAGYERTMTDVWFSSEEAAERAGFKRAQR